MVGHAVGQGGYEEAAHEKGSSRAELGVSGRMTSNENRQPFSTSIFKHKNKSGSDKAGHKNELKLTEYLELKKN